MRGRKPIYDVKTLEIGAKMELLGKAKKYPDQYIYNFNQRTGELVPKFKKVADGKRVFVERIA